MPEIRIVEFKTNDPFDKRFAIADAESGEILDDAQGYGYKTPQKAHACWSWKSKAPSDKTNARAREDKAKKWLAKHRDIVDMLEYAAFNALKCGEKGPVTADLRKYLEDNGIDVEGNDPKDIMKAWRKGS